MKIIFGKGLDGSTWFPEFRERQSVVGEVVVGELGFLRLLEVAAGTTAPEISDVRRGMTYLSALRATDAPKRFFHASLQVDEFGVARHLLGIRDELRRAGWDGSAVVGVPRSADLAAMEVHAATFPGKADRFARAMMRISSLKSVPIESVTLVDSLESFDIAVRRALSALKDKGVRMDALAAAPQKGTSSDLAHVQSHVNGKKASAAQNDDTFRVATAANPWSAARWTAAWLAALQPTEREQTALIVPERYRSILAAAFHQVGVPFGAEAVALSAARPSVQILVLSLVLAWAPKHPAFALALLTLPLSPIPRGVAFRLAHSLAEAPAVASDEWNTALEEALAHLTQTKSADDSRKAGDRVKDWFDAQAVPQGTGAPTDKLTEICGRVEKWSRPIGVSGRASFAETAVLARELRVAIEESGKESFLPDELLNLLRSLVSGGVGATAVRPQAGGPVIVSHPGAVISPAGTVVWWDFSSGANVGVGTPFWSRRERELFRKAGVDLREPVDAAAEAARMALRPFMAASERFLGITFDVTDSGESESPHPILDTLLPGSRDDRKAWMAKTMIRADGAPDGPGARFASEVGARMVPATPVSWTGRVHWTIPANLAAVKNGISATSAEKALGCGLAYALSYLAGFKDDRISLPEGNLLRGRIAHKVFESVFSAGKPLSPEKAAAKAGTELDDLLHSYAAVLLAPEARMEASDLRETIVRAARSYATFLADNRLEVLGAEMALKGSIPGFDVTGTADQVLGRNGSAELVLDFKWRGESQKRNGLAEGTALQLSLYTHLLKKRDRFPDAGYFFVEAAKAVVLGRVYEGAETVQGPALSDVLAQAGDFLRERSEAFTKGALVADGLTDGQDSAKWKAPCSFCEMTTICGKPWAEQ